MAIVFTLYIVILKLTGYVSIGVKRYDQGDVILVKNKVCNNIIDSYWLEGKCQCKENAATFHCWDDKPCGCYNRTEIDPYESCTVYLDSSPVNVPTFTEADSLLSHKYSYNGNIIGQFRSTTVQLWENDAWQSSDWIFFYNDDEEITLEANDDIEGKLVKITSHSNQSGGKVCMLIKLEGETTYTYFLKSTSRPVKSTAGRTFSPVISPSRTKPANTDNSSQNNAEIIAGILIPILLICALILIYFSYRYKRKRNKGCNGVQTNTQNNNVDNVADTRAYATLNLQNVPENNYAYLSQQSIYSQPYATRKMNEDTDPPLYRTVTNTEGPLYMVTEPDEENKIHPVYAVTEPENNNCDDELAVSENKYSDTPAPIYMETEPET